MKAQVSVFWPPVTHSSYCPLLCAPAPSGDPDPTSTSFQLPPLQRALKVPLRLFELDRKTSFLPPEVKARAAWNFQLGVTAAYPNSFSFPDMDPQLLPSSADTRAPAAADAVPKSRENLKAQEKCCTSCHQANPRESCWPGRNPCG